MINHEADTLYGIVGFTEKHDYEQKIMEVFHKIRRGEKTSQDDLEFSIVHLVGAYDGYNALVLPMLGTIYGNDSDSFKELGALEFSYQMEALIKYSSKEMKIFILNMFLYRIIDEFNK